MLSEEGSFRACRKDSSVLLAPISPAGRSQPIADTRKEPEAHNRLIRLEQMRGAGIHAAIQSILILRGSAADLSHNLKTASLSTPCTMHHARGNEEVPL